VKKVIIIGVITLVIGTLGFSVTKLYNKEVINYDITSVTESKEIKSEDGTTLVNIKYSYPIVENKRNSKFLNSVNEEYRLNAEKFLKDAEESKVEAQSLYEELKEVFRPYTRELDFDINMNNKGLISITNNNYYYNGGAHGSYIMKSRTFDVNNGLELTLDKVINNDVWNIKENVHKLFEEKLQNDGLDLSNIWGELLKEEIDNVNYYIKDGALVLYFNAEQIAPYALGAPTVEVPYDENIFLINIENSTNNLVKSLIPTGFAGSSLNRIDLYQNGDVYWIQYDGQGIGDENIVQNMLVANNAKDIEMFEDEGINVVGDNVKIATTINIGWLIFNK
jgi:hypothetical protein